MQKEEIERIVRESLLQGEHILERIDTVINNLTCFSGSMKNLQAAAELLQVSSSIDTTINRLEGLGSLLDEVHELEENLRLVPNPRRHIKKLKRAGQILEYFKKHTELPESKELVKSLKASIEIGRHKISEVIRNELQIYAKLYGITPIVDSKEQTQSIIALKSLLKESGQEGWNEYFSQRGLVIEQYLKESIPKIKDIRAIDYAPILDKIIEALAIEQQLQQVLLDQTNVSDTINEVIDRPFKFMLKAIIEWIHSSPSPASLLHFLENFHKNLQNFDMFLGGTSRIQSINELGTKVIYSLTHYFQSALIMVEESKVNNSEYVDDLCLKVYQDLYELRDYKPMLKEFGLDESPLELILKTIEGVKSKSLHLSRGNGMGKLYIVNNLSFWREASNPLSAFINAELKQTIEKQLLSYLQEFLTETWGRLIPVLSDTPSVLEFRKTNVLTRNSRNAVKHKFNTFNAVWSCMVTEQKDLKIYSEDILKLLRRKIQEFILPRYKVFQEKFLSVDFTRHISKYTLYNMDSVSSILNSIYILKR